jgi:membrane-associated phospholipid phosphatase
MAWGAQIGAGRSGPIAAFIYSIGYWPFLLVGLAISLRSGRSLFQRALLSVALSGLVGLTVMALFPVAPPRLVGEPDVVAQHEMSALAHPDGLINPYAAMPSFHVAWSLISALAIGAAMPRARWIVLAYPMVVSIVVVITGNHYVLDVIVGASIAATTWWFCGTPRSTMLFAPSAT